MTVTAASRLLPLTFWSPSTSPGRGDTERRPLLEGSDLHRVLLPLVAVLLAGLLILTPAFAADDPKPADNKPAETKKEPPDKGDTAWMLVSSALVMFMLPGLAL